MPSELTDPPLDYLIFHPQRTQYQASGTARIDDRLEAWTGPVWTDRISPRGSSNEDPFIWTASWLYSYCHATQLRRVFRKGPFVREGSRLFFCSASDAKDGMLKVDTVFEVARCVRWQPAGTVPAEFLQLGEESIEWMRHFRHGTSQPDTERAHTGSFTYVAQMGGASFLPMNTKGHAFSVCAATVVPEKVEKIIAANPSGRNSYPVMLTTSEAEALLTELQRAPVRVTSINP